MNFFLDKLFRHLRTKQIISLIPDDTVICDIGCGANPYFLKAVRDFIAHGIGVDKNIPTLQDPKLEFRKLEVSKVVPLGDESCDVVTMIAVLEHVEYPEDIIREVYRILRKEGRFVITIPTPAARMPLEILAKFRLVDAHEIAARRVSYTATFSLWNSKVGGGAVHGCGDGNCYDFCRGSR